MPAMVTLHHLYLYMNDECTVKNLLIRIQRQDIISFDLLWYHKRLWDGADNNAVAVIEVKCVVYVAMKDFPVEIFA